MLTDGSFTGQNPLCVRKTLRGNDIQIGPSHSMNFRTCSVVQRFGFVFVITDSCNGQTHGQTSNPVPHSLFESTGSSEGLEFTSCGMYWWLFAGRPISLVFPVSPLSHWARCRKRSSWIYSTDTAWCQTGPLATEPPRCT